MGGLSCSKVLHILFIEIIEGCQCGVNKDSNRHLQARIKQLDKNKAIVGGQEADINSIPWQVGIMGNCYFRDLKITLLTTVFYC